MIYKLSSSITLLILLIIFYFIFTTNDLQFFNEKKNTIENFKNSNYLIFIIIFIIFSTIWTIFIGLGTPLTLFSGFFFGNITGTLLLLVCFSFGSTIFFFFSKKFFLKKIKKFKFISKRKKLIDKIRLKEFDYFLIFRLAGGFKLPLLIQNMIPISFNMKTKNFFLATILGMGPSTFVNVSIGQGLREFINIEEKISFFLFIQKSEIYIPLIGIFLLITLSYIIKKKKFDNI